MTQLDPQVHCALTFCSEHKINKFVLTVPFGLPIEQIQLLRQDPRIISLVVKTPEERLRKEYGTWLCPYLPDAYTWDHPPRSTETIVFAGMRSRLAFRMMRAYYCRGFRRIVCCTAYSWVHFRLSHLLLDRILEHAIGRAQRLFGLSPLTSKITHHVSKTPYMKLFADARRFAASRQKSIRRRVVLVNSALAPGGAERQLVYTLKGLRDEGLEPILFCEDLRSRPGHDFYLAQIQTLGIPVREVTCGVDHYQLRQELLDYPKLFKSLDKIPWALRDDVMALYFIFRDLRPEVVHAWQDTTSIKAGIAATLAGVPHIVLSSRNVSPPHFAYHQDYMRPAYQALAELNHIVLANNSQAGAEDYAKWLGISPSRFTLVRNGVDLSSLHRAQPDEILQFRKQLGIPIKAPVVGSVFRFWPEKRPLLWIEMAAYVATKFPEVHFLIVGWGPLRNEMENLANTLGLDGRLHLIEERHDIAMPVSAMDLFVLASQYEGTPNVVLESQTLGVPVLATNAGGTSEAIEQGVTGWIVVDPPTAAQIGKQVISLLRNAEQLVLAKTRGPAFIQAHFGIDRMVQETLMAYGATECGEQGFKPRLVDNAGTPQ